MLSRIGYRSWKRSSSWLTRLSSTLRFFYLIYLLIETILLIRARKWLRLPQLSLSFLCKTTFRSILTWYYTTASTQDAELFVTAWRSGNVVGRINEVTLRRARLVLGWVTVFGGQTTSVFPPTLSGTGNAYQPKCSDASRLASKGRHGSFHLYKRVGMAGKTVWSLVNTCHTWALYMQMSHYKALYKSIVTVLYRNVNYAYSPYCLASYWNK